MTIHYSETTNAFYTTTRLPPGGLPGDAVEITPTVHRQLLDSQSSGNLILSDGAGNPTTIPRKSELLYELTGTGGNLVYTALSLSAAKANVLDALQNRLVAELEPTNIHQIRENDTGVPMDTGLKAVRTAYWAAYDSDVIATNAAISVAALELLLPGMGL